MAKKIKLKLSDETLGVLSSAIASVESHKKSGSLFLQVFCDGTAKGLALYGDEADKAALAIKPFWDSSEPYEGD